MILNHVRKIFCRLLISAVVLSSFFVSVPCVDAFLWGKVDSFTADQVSVSPQGDVLSTSKIYVKPDAFRMDGLPGTGQNQMVKSRNFSMYSFEDQKVSSLYNHDKKLYYQMKPDEDLAGLSSVKEAEQVKELGTEKVSGYKCTKKQITRTVSMYGMVNKTTMTVWESDKFRMPLRSKLESGHIMELRNIEKGKPDDKVFELPQGYQKVDNMMAVMGISMGGMMKQAEKGDANTDSEGQDGFKMPEIKTENIQKAINNLGDKLKNFKFGKE